MHERRDTFCIYTCILVQAYPVCIRNRNLHTRRFTHPQHLCSQIEPMTQLVASQKLQEQESLA